MYKRFLSICIVALLVFSMFGAAFATDDMLNENEPYYIEVSHTYDNDAALNGWGIHGVEVVSHTVDVGGGKETVGKQYYNREYNIILGRDTPDGAILNIWCDITSTGMWNPTINNAPNTMPAAVKESWNNGSVN